MSKIGIIGSGNVGANTAFFIAETGLTDVLLYDIREGYAKGISLDIMEAAPVRGYRNGMVYTNTCRRRRHYSLYYWYFYGKGQRKAENGSPFERLAARYLHRHHSIRNIRLSYRLLYGCRYKHILGDTRRALRRCAYRRKHQLLHFVFQ